MKTTSLVFLGLVLVLAPVASGQTQKIETRRTAIIPEPPQAPAPTPVAPGRSEDEKLIRGAIEAFVQAFDKGDAKAIASLFTEQGEAIAMEGGAIRGRDALEAHYAERFVDNPGEKIKTTIELIHFLAPEVVRQDGRSTLQPADGSLAITAKYTSTFVKTQGRWLIASIRELEDPSITPHDRLRELEWLVGDWLEETGDALIATSITWSEDKNFLLRSFEIKTQGKADMKGSQRIGWDPLTKQIKSWVFDSKGGHAESYWSRSGDQWVIKAQGVHADGVTTSGTQTLTMVNKDRLLWKSTDRTLGGETEDDIQEFMMVRKPPEPK
jgi:uncharacterized protein (TIGR02246 family)